MDGLTPGLALAAYVESFLEGRRVAVFGDATSTLADELLERGSRVVHVYDPEPARAAEAGSRNRSKQISILPLEEIDIAVRDGAFDVAIVPDLSIVEFGEELLKQVRRALSPRGIAVVAAPNPDAKLALLPRTSGSARALSYYDLYDAVSAQFAEVRMLGQTPLVGYAVVDFAPESDPEVAFDSGLVPGGAEEPEWFIALASQRPVELESFSVIQLSASKVLKTRSDGRLEEEVRAARTAEARTAERAAELEAEILNLRAKLKAAEADDGRERIVELETELERRVAAIRDLESRALSSDSRIDDAREELERLRATAATAQGAAAEAEALRVERDELAKRIAARDTELKRLTEVAAVEGTDELGDLEKLLKERGDRVRSLEGDLREAERIGRELVREIAHVRTVSARALAEPTPSPDAAHLAVENARLHADLEAAAWSVSELEERLARAAPRGEGALAQELESARTELQRQAALLAQLRARDTATR